MVAVSLETRTQGWFGPRRWGGFPLAVGSVDRRPARGLPDGGTHASRYNVRSGRVRRKTTSGQSIPPIAIDYCTSEYIRTGATRQAFSSHIPAGPNPPDSLRFGAVPRAFCTGASSSSTPHVSRSAASRARPCRLRSAFLSTFLWSTCTLRPAACLSLFRGPPQRMKKARSIAEDRPGREVYAASVLHANINTCR